jgi:hypothetical protein
MLTAMAILNKPLQLAKHGMNLWRKHRLSGAFVEAQAALGERMFAAGVDDGEFGAKISALDGQLLWAKVVGGSVHALKSIRHQLVLQLAAAALENDGPLPGANTEYRKTRDAQAALERHEKGMGASKAEKKQKKDEEERYQSYRQTFTLPCGVNADKTVATYRRVGVAPT